MEKVKLTISIVTYNSVNVIGPCIDSIQNAAYSFPHEIIIIDNCSKDETYSFVKKNYPFVKLHLNEKNAGFGRAHNQAFKMARGEYFLILNPDTIVFKNTLLHILDFMEKRFDVSLCGCTVYLDKGKNFIFPDLKIHSLKTAILHFTPFLLYFPYSKISKRYWHEAYRLWLSREPVKVDGITGGFMLVKSEAFSRVKGFDEKFFLFFEEHDLQLRIKQSGGAIFYIPNVSILHYFEQSCKTASFDIGSVYVESAKYYYKKHYKAFGLSFIKLLISFNKKLQSLRQKGLLLSSLERQGMFENIKIPANTNTISLSWEGKKGIKDYIIEISHALEFADRGGTYVSENYFSIDKAILEQLPGKKVYIKVSQYDIIKNTVKTLKLFEIDKQQLNIDQ